MPGIKISFPAKTVKDITVPEGSFFFHTLDNAIADDGEAGFISVDELSQITAWYTLYADDPSEQGLYKKLVDALNISTNNDELILSYEN